MPFDSCPASNAPLYIQFNEKHLRENNADGHCYKLLSPSHKPSATLWGRCKVICSAWVRTWRLSVGNNSSQISGQWEWTQNYSPVLDAHSCFTQGVGAQSFQSWLCHLLTLGEVYTLVLFLVYNVRRLLSIILKASSSSKILWLADLPLKYFFLIEMLPFNFSIQWNPFKTYGNNLLIWRGPMWRLRSYPHLFFSPSE